MQPISMKWKVSLPTYILHNTCNSVSIIYLHFRCKECTGMFMYIYTNIFGFSFTVHIVVSKTSFINKDMTIFANKTFVRDGILCILWLGLVSRTNDMRTISGCRWFLFIFQFPILSSKWPRKNVGCFCAVMPFLRKIWRRSVHAPLLCLLGNAYIVSRLHDFHIFVEIVA